METLKIILKIAWFMLAISYRNSYRKTDNLKDYIAYWGCMLLALLY